MTSLLNRLVFFAALTWSGPYVFGQEKGSKAEAAEEGPGQEEGSEAVKAEEGPADDTEDKSDADKNDVISQGDALPSASEAAPPAEGVTSVEATVKKPAPLTGKLFMGTSFGWARLFGDGGSWNARGASDILVGYLLPGVSMLGMSWWSALRYVPYSVTVMSDKNKSSYRGVVESYGLGMSGHKALKGKMSYHIGTELLTTFTALSQTSDIDFDTDLEGVGFLLALSGGIDWTFAEKIKFGPKLIVGFGSFRTVQFGGSVSLML